MLQPCSLQAQQREAGPLHVRSARQINHRTLRSDAARGREGHGSGSGVGAAHDVNTDEAEQRRERVTCSEEREGGSEPEVGEEQDIKALCWRLEHI